MVHGYSHRDKHALDGKQNAEQKNKHGKICEQNCPPVIFVSQIMAPSRDKIVELFKKLGIDTVYTVPDYISPDWDEIILDEATIHWLATPYHTMLDQAKKTRKLIKLISTSCTSTLPDNVEPFYQSVMQNFLYDYQAQTVMKLDLDEFDISETTDDVQFGFVDKAIKPMDEVYLLKLIGEFKSSIKKSNEIVEIVNRCEFPVIEDEMRKVKLRNQYLQLQLEQQNEQITELRKRVQKYNSVNENTETKKRGRKRKSVTTLL